jgi:hypothetical protein
MRPPDLSLNTESKPAATQISKFVSEGAMTLHAKDLPNATIQPFKVWHPPRMKTGLRNQPIGRKVSMFALPPLGTVALSPNLKISAGE